MDYLIGWKKCEMEFNAEAVKMELLPLTIEAAIALTPLAGKMIGAGSDVLDNGLDFQTKMLTMQQDAAPVLSQHVRGIEGFTLNGENPTIELLCSIPGFCPLVAKIIAELITGSTLLRDEAKN